MSVFTEEELSSSVRRFLTDKAPSEAVRRWMESENGFDPAVWQVAAEQLGLPGLALPEEFGGAGGGPVELGVVLEETGRALLPSPFFLVRIPMSVTRMNRESLTEVIAFFFVSSQPRAVRKNKPRSLPLSWGLRR